MDMAANRLAAPAISIVIVNWNVCNLLRGCIDSIHATVPPLRFEVIVVDNAPEDGSATMVQCWRNRWGMRLRRVAL
jgi:hypothetical protein